jgi:hypothetical protein
MTCSWDADGWDEEEGGLAVAKCTLAEPDCIVGCSETQKLKLIFSKKFNLFTKNHRLTSVFSLDFSS